MTNAQDSVLIAYPNSSSGSVEVRASSGNFWDLHFDFTENVIDQHWFRLDSLVGYRYCRYDEGVQIGQKIVIVNPPPGSSFAEGTQIATVDNFSTQNAFNGCDLGLRTHLCWNRLSLDLLTKVAVGDLHRQVNINGSQVTTVPGAPAPSSQAGGVLALSTNSGNYSSNEFTYVPEIGANLSWDVTSRLQVRLGYSALFLNHVARAAEQIDPTVNPNLFPPANPSLGGPSRPAFNLNKSDIWMQSISFGLLFTY